MHWGVLPGITLITDIVALALLVTSFVTDHWVEYDVDREALAIVAVSDLQLEQNLETFPFYQDHHKGIFHVCYTGDLLDDCITRTGYEIDGMDSDSEWSSVYKTRVYLMRTHLFSMGIGLLCLFLTFVIIVIGFCTKKAIGFRIACCFATAACFAIALAMAVFHGVDYVEKKDMETEEFPAGWNSMYEHYELSNNVEITFGYSLFAGWAALVVAIITAIMALWTGVNIPTELEESKRNLSQGGAASDTEGSYYSSSLARNRAYDIVEDKDGGDDLNEEQADEQVFKDNKGKDIYFGMGAEHERY